MTQAQVAHKLGVSRNWVGRMERGEVPHRTLFRFWSGSRWTR